MSNQTVTMTYAELVEKLNALGAEVIAASNARTGESNTFSAEQQPAPGLGGWRITLRSDPHRNLLDGVQDTLRWNRAHMLGLAALRDEGDRGAKITLTGFYEALARLVPQIEIVDGGAVADTIKGARDYRRVLEDETEAAYGVEHVVTCAYYLALWTQMDAAGKSEAPSTDTTPGESTE